MRIPLVNRINIKTFIELFLSIIESGINIPAALNILAKDEKTEFYAESIIRQMEENTSFSHSFCSLSNKLSAYEHMLTIAEETGDIVPILKNIIFEINDKDYNTKQLISVSVYPVLMSLFAFTLSFILFNYGIPYISQIADISKNELTLGILKANTWLVFSVILLVFLSSFIIKKNYFQYKFFQNLYYLTLNSVGIESSLELLLRTEGFSTKERRDIALILESIRNGELLYIVCQKTKLFDIYTQAWLTSAESSGNIQESFEKIYAHYNLIRKNSREVLLRVIEPSILFIAGIYIVILIVTCVVPIFLTLGTTIL